LTSVYSNLVTLSDQLILILTRTLKLKTELENNQSKQFVRQFANVMEFWRKFNETIPSHMSLTWRC
jgi:hypothetical protein